MKHKDISKNSNIQLLPPELANQIAAGEVVERPSSVLKELIENSLDASASSINAIIEDGGQASIKVSDNGKGIPKEELALAVTRHATSKINNIRDLSTINSFGFRGEALPSIASVSRFRIASCWVDEPDKQAYALDVNFGEHKEIQPVALYKGTQVEVRDLFNNIPARLKFLKNPNTELKRAQEIFTRVGLIHTNVAFEFSAGTRKALTFLLEDSLFERLCKIWSPSITNDMLEVNNSIYDMNITGFISNPRSLYAKADKLLLYVNKRPVSDKLLIRAIRQAYKHSLTTKDYPQVIINININPEEVDVNVHPAKSEVRFRDEQSIFKALYVSLEKVLEKKLFLHQVNARENSQKNIESQNLLREPSSDFSTFSSTFSSYEEKNSYNKIENNFENTQNNMQPSGFWGYADTFSKGLDKQGMSMIKDKKVFEKNFEEVIYKPSLTQDNKVNQESIISEKKNTSHILPHFLCQIESSYLLFQQHNGTLFILDQHAVHERVLFDKLAKKEILANQKLLVPISISLHSSEYEAFLTVQQELKNTGFQCVYEENENFLECTEIPLEFNSATAEKFLQKVLKNSIVDIHSLFIDYACDKAIKANQNLTHAEAINLYQQWLLCEQPDFCPHGRPCYILIDKEYLDKLFKRT